MTFLMTLIQIFIFHIITILTVGIIILQYGSKIKLFLDEYIDLESYLDFEFEEPVIE